MQHPPPHTGALWRRMPAPRKHQKAPGSRVPQVSPMRDRWWGRDYVPLTVSVVENTVGKPPRPSPFLPLIPGRSLYTPQEAQHNQVPTWTHSSMALASLLVALPSHSHMCWRTWIHSKNIWKQIHSSGSTFGDKVRASFLISLILISYPQAMGLNLRCTPIFKPRLQNTWKPNQVSPFCCPSDKV